MLKELITIRHLENVMNKIILLTGSIVGYAYSMEFFIAYPYEQWAFLPVRAGSTKSIFINRARSRGCPGPLLVGLLDDDQLQRALAAGVLVEGACAPASR